MKSLLILMSLAAVVSSCSDDEVPAGYSEGVVRFTSETATGGCGYVLEINGGTYYPISLDPKFQQNNRLVYVKYQTTGQRVPCEDAPNPTVGFDQIRIDDIRSK